MLFTAQVFIAITSHGKQMEKARGRRAFSAFRGEVGKPAPIFYDQRA